MQRPRLVVFNPGGTLETPGKVFIRRVLDPQQIEQKVQRISYGYPVLYHVFLARCLGSTFTDYERLMQKFPKFPNRKNTF